MSFASTKNEWKEMEHDTWKYFLTTLSSAEIADLDTLLFESKVKK